MAPIIVHRSRKEIAEKLFEVEEQMVVKSLTVPPGLEPLMEGLTREVLKKHPQDICRFAAEYFYRLIQMHDKLEATKKLAKKKLVIKKKQIHPKKEVELIKPKMHLSVPQLNGFNSDIKISRSEASTAEIDKIQGEFFESKNNDENKIDFVEIDDDKLSNTESNKTEEMEIITENKEESIEIKNLKDLSEEEKEVQVLEIRSDDESNETVSEINEELINLNSDIKTSDQYNEEQLIEDIKEINNDFDNKKSINEENIETLNEISNIEITDQENEELIIEEIESLNEKINNDIDTLINEKSIIEVNTDLINTTEDIEKSVKENKEQIIEEIENIKEKTDNDNDNIDEKSIIEMNTNLINTIEDIEGNEEEKIKKIEEINEETINNDIDNIEIVDKSIIEENIELVKTIHDIEKTDQENVEQIIEEINDDATNSDIDNINFIDKSIIEANTGLIKTIHGIKNMDQENIEQIIEEVEKINDETINNDIDNMEIINKSINEVDTELIKTIYDIEKTDQENVEQIIEEVKEINDEITNNDIDNINIVDKSIIEANTELIKTIHDIENTDHENVEQIIEKIQNVNDEIIKNDIDNMNNRNEELTKEIRDIEESIQENEEQIIEEREIINDSDGINITGSSTIEDVIEEKIINTENALEIIDEIKNNVEHIEKENIVKNNDIPLKEIKNEDSVEEHFEKKKHDAAIKIQSLWKGYSLRKLQPVSQLKEKTSFIDINDNIPELNKAAIVIQSLWKGYNVRKNQSNSQMDITEKLNEEITEISNKEKDMDKYEIEQEIIAETMMRNEFENVISGEKNENKQKEEIYEQQSDSRQNDDNNEQQLSNDMETLIDKEKEEVEDEKKVIFTVGPYEVIKVSELIDNENEHIEIAENLIEDITTNVENIINDETVNESETILDELKIINDVENKKENETKITNENIVLDIHLKEENETILEGHSEVEITENNKENEPEEDEIIMKTNENRSILTLQHSGEMHDSIVQDVIDISEETTVNKDEDGIEEDKITLVEEDSQDKEMTSEVKLNTLLHSSEMHDSIIVPDENEINEQQIYDDLKNENENNVVIVKEPQMVINVDTNEMEIQSEHLEKEKVKEDIISIISEEDLRESTSTIEHETMHLSENLNDFELDLKSSLQEAIDNLEDEEERSKRSLDNDEAIKLLEENLSNDTLNNLTNRENIDESLSEIAEEIEEENVDNIITEIATNIKQVSTIEDNENEAEKLLTNDKLSDDIKTDKKEIKEVILNTTDELQEEEIKQENNDEFVKNKYNTKNTEAIIEGNKKELVINSKEDIEEVTETTLDHINDEADDKTSNIFDETRIVEEMVEDFTSNAVVIIGNEEKLDDTNTEHGNEEKGKKIEEIIDDSTTKVEIVLNEEIVTKEDNSNNELIKTVNDSIDAVVMVGNEDKLDETNTEHVNEENGNKSEKIIKVETVLNEEMASEEDNSNTELIEIVNNSIVDIKNNSDSTIFLQEKIEEKEDLNNQTSDVSKMSSEETIDIISNTQIDNDNGENNILESINDISDEINDQVKKIPDSVINSVKEFTEESSETINDITESVVKNISDTIDETSAQLKGLKISAEDTVKEITENGDQVIEKIKDEIVDINNEDKEKAIENTNEKIKEVDNNELDINEKMSIITIAQNVPDLIDKVNEELDDAESNIDNTIDEISENIEHVEKHQNTAEEIKNDIINNISKLNVEVNDKISSNINNEMSLITDTVEKNMLNITDNINDEKEKIIDDVNDVITTATETVNEKTKEITEKIEETEETVINEIQNKIEDVSKIIENEKINVETNLMNIENNVKEKLLDVKEETQKTVENLSDNLKTIKMEVDESVNSVEDTLREMGDKVKDHAAEVKEEVVETVEKSQENLKDITDTVQQNIEEKLVGVTNLLNENKEEINNDIEEITQISKDKIENMSEKVEDISKKINTKVLTNLTEDVAATKIQSVWRGFKTRKNIEKEKLKNLQKPSECDELSIDRGEINGEINEISFKENGESRKPSIEELEEDLNEIKELNERLKNLTKLNVYEEDSSLSENESLQYKNAMSQLKSDNEDSENSEIKNILSTGKIPLIDFDNFDSSKYDLKTENLTPRSKSSSPIQELSSAAFKIGALFAVSDTSSIETINSPKKEENSVEYIHISLHESEKKNEEVTQPIIENVVKQTKEVKSSASTKLQQQDSNPTEYIYIPLKDPNAKETEVHTDNLQSLQHSGEFHDIICLPEEIKEDKTAKSVSNNFSTLKKSIDESIIEDKKYYITFPENEDIETNKTSVSDNLIYASSASNFTLVANNDVKVNDITLNKDVKNTDHIEDTIEEHHLPSLPINESVENDLKKIPENLETLEIGGNKDFSKQIEEIDTFIEKNKTQIDTARISSPSSSNRELFEEVNAIINTYNKSLPQNDKETTPDTKTIEATPIDVKKLNENNSNDEHGLIQRRNSLESNKTYTIEDNISPNNITSPEDNSSDEELAKQEAAKKIQNSYRNYRKKRSISAENINKDDTSTLEDQIFESPVFNGSQIETQTKELNTISDVPHSSNNFKTKRSLGSNSSLDTIIEDTSTTIYDKQPTNDLQLIKKIESIKIEKQNEIDEQVKQDIDNKKLETKNSETDIIEEKYHDNSDSQLEIQKIDEDKNLQIITKDKNCVTEEEKKKVEIELKSEKDPKTDEDSDNLIHEESPSKNGIDEKNNEITIKLDSAEQSKKENDILVDKTTTENMQVITDSPKNKEVKTQNKEKITDSHLIEFKTQSSTDSTATTEKDQQKETQSTDDTPTAEAQETTTTTTTTETEDDQYDIITSGIQSESSSTFEDEDTNEKSSSDGNIQPGFPRNITRGVEFIGAQHDTIDIKISSEELSQGQVYVIIVSHDIIKGAEMLTSPSAADRFDADSHSEMEATQEEQTLPQQQQSTLSQQQRHKNNNAMDTQKTNQGDAVAAATKIQAGFRGYQVRKQMKIKKTGSEDQKSLKRCSNRRKSASRRGTIDNLKASDLEEKSATKIQAGIRGFLVRKRQKNTKDKQA